VALGIVGAFVPLLPTTVFLVLAASCYARASTRFYQRLMSHPTFGPIVRDWREHRRMSPRAKRLALTMIGVTFAVSLWMIPLAWVRVLHILIGAALVVFILRIKTRP
jgi:uncharacterized membrane protein YbaN (DUF454 family)